MKEKVFITTTDSENKMRSAFQDEERTGCVAHIDSVNRMKGEIKKIAQKHKSYTFKYALEKQQAKNDVKQKSLKQNIDTRFVFTLISWKSFLNDPNANVDDDNKLEPEDANDAIKRNIHSINETLEICEDCHLTIRSEEVEKMKNVVKYMAPFEEATTLLGGDKYVSASVVLPTLKKIEKHMEVEEDDPNYLVQMKRNMSNDLKARVNKNLNMSVLSKCAALDPRFKSLKLGRKQ